MHVIKSCDACDKVPGLSDNGKMALVHTARMLINCVSLYQLYYTPDSCGACTCDRVSGLDDDGFTTPSGGGN